VIPIISGVVAWLGSKFPGQKPFPAPNNQPQIRLGTVQYEIYFITNADDALTATTNISQRPILPPATSRAAVIIADLPATAARPDVQSAINSNFPSGTPVYLGYLELREVKKWP
jgi:hypothetical protein